MSYDSINALSSAVYRIQAYYETVGLYDIEYICEAEPKTELADEAWRVSRIRYLTGTTTLFDKTYAEGADARKFDYGIGTARFCHKATDLATVKALTYNDA